MEAAASTRELTYHGLLSPEAVGLYLTDGEVLWRVTGRGHGADVVLEDCLTLVERPFTVRSIVRRMRLVRPAAD